jgi:hypothetical protein
MTTTIHQKINRKLRAQQRRIEVEKQYVAQLYEGDEGLNFRFDAFNLWSMDAPKCPDVWAFLRNHGIIDQMDRWNRGVFFDLPKEHAVELAALVECWNIDMEDEESGRNPWYIGFSQASGTERVISVPTGGRHLSDSWQWS